jgi:hypothetical protein
MSETTNERVLINDPVRLTLTVDEIITSQAALKVAKEHKAVTPEIADSALDKLDKAINRWAAA